MTLYMLDTDTCIYAMRKKPSIVQKRFNTTPREALCVSMVTLGELAFGISRSRIPVASREIVDDFTERLAVVPWDEDAAWEFGTLRHFLEVQGNPIGVLDTMIAAHALSLNATIVTNNVRHFERVPDLRLENWAIVEDRSTNGQNGWSK